LKIKLSSLTSRASFTRARCSGYCVAGSCNYFSRGKFGSVTALAEKKDSGMKFSLSGGERGEWGIGGRAGGTGEEYMFS
jgi:hypothetical protein